MMPFWAFDPGEVEYLVDLVRQGETVSVAPLLDRLVPLADTLPRDSALVKPTLALIEALRALDPDRIEATWLAWIAYAAAHKIYSDVPKQSARNKANAGRPRSALTVEIIEAKRQEMEVRLRRKVTVDDLAEALGSNPSTIRRRLGLKK